MPEPSVGRVQVLCDACVNEKKHEGTFKNNNKPVTMNRYIIFW